MSGLLEISLSDLALSVLLGGALGAGLLCMLTAVPRWGASPLDQRIAPYIRDVVDDAALPSGALPTAGVLPIGVDSMWRRARAVFDRLLGGSEQFRVRLLQAGIELDPAAARARQLGWGIAGLVVGALVVVVLAVAGRMTPGAALLPIVAAATGVIAYDMVLTSRVKARRARLAEELPTTLEFLTLCLAAGESLLDALTRVSSIGTGELSTELRHTVLAIRTGSQTADALGELAHRLDLPSLGRAVDQIVAAIEHGAPLAGVLHAQAADAREEAKRMLIEQAGRKEIVMLLPLVFLILPLSVLYAVYPGVFILRLGIL